MPTYFPPDADTNISLNLGSPSGGLADVDLDDPAAVFLAPEFLPQTEMIHGRPGNPASHWWYVVGGDKVDSVSFADPDGTTLVELRGDRHATCVPPSIHPDGEPYQWDTFGTPTMVDYQDLLTRVERLAACALLARHWPEEGSRHNLSLALAGALCRNGWEEEEAAEFIRSAAEAAEDEEADDRASTVASTASRLGAGDTASGLPTLSQMLPEPVMSRVVRWLRLQSTTRALVPARVVAPILPQNSPAAEGVVTVLEAIRQAGLQITNPNGSRNEVQSRDLWIGQNSWTVYSRGEWRRYREGIWVPLDDLQIRREVGQVLTLAGANVSSAKVTSVVELIKAEVFTDPSTWDTNTDVLVCANGTLDLKTGQLRDHDPKDYATTKLNYNFDPAAEAPSWQRVIGRLSSAVRWFLQEFVGYSLTPDTRHEIAVWLVGPGGGGKSTFIEGIQTMLGPKHETLGLASIVASRYSLPRLAGKTLVLATEQPADFIRSTETLKALISGEEIEAERKFRDPFTFRPIAKLLWAMNEEPRLPGADSGIFRRIKIVEWPALPATERDVYLKDRLAAEGAGILNWALEGLRRLRDRGGFDIPPEVRQASEEFQRSNDVAGLFVDECCVTGEGCSEDADTLYRAYAAWCDEVRHKAKTKTAVARDWKRLGFTSGRTSTARRWYGVMLAPEARIRLA